MLPPRFARRKVQALAGLLCAFGCAAPAGAHEFWIEPSRFSAAPQGTVSFTLQVGHGAQRQRSPIPLARIVRFGTMSPEGAWHDQRARLTLRGAAGDGAVDVGSLGAHVIVLETDDAGESHLPADRFNEHLTSEGLTPAIRVRERRRRTEAEGSESYGRRAKAIVQVGPPGAGSQVRATRPLGLSLEIVPEVSPYALPRPPRLPVRVIYLGRPLAGALVKFTRLEADETPFETARTDRSGRASFTMPTAGRWLLNVVWTKPLPRKRSTDFETVFSSLSFGFPPDGG